MTSGSGSRPRPATPFVSVAMGTRNGVRFIEAQLLSILDQSRSVDEIVVSDDASTDGTVERAEQLMNARRASGELVPRLIVLRNATALGVTANFEQALRTARGDVVVLSDQDDIWRPDRVERALDVIAASPFVDLVASDARLVDEDGAPLGASLFETLGVDAVLARRLGSDGAFDELVKRNMLTGATMAVTRSLVDRTTPFPASWVHDEWLAIVAATTGGIAVLEERLIDYRQHGANEIGVARLGTGGKIGRLRESRMKRNELLLRRAQDLAERLPEIAGDHVQQRVTEKLAHEQFRSGLSPKRLRRLVPVLREWRTGRYSRFGLGAQDVLRDLVQPV